MKSGDGQIIQLSKTSRVFWSNGLLPAHDRKARPCRLVREEVAEECKKLEHRRENAAVPAHARWREGAASAGGPARLAEKTEPSAYAF